MNKAPKFVACILVVLMLVCMVGCSSRSSFSSGSESESSEPEVEVFDLHLSIDFVWSTVLAIQNVDVFVDETPIGSVKQGETLSEKVSLEEGSHVVLFKQPGKDKILAQSEITLEEEMYYECSIKSSKKTIEIIDELFETPSERDSRLADEKAKLEEEEAQKKADEEKAKEEAKKKAEEERAEKAKAEEEAKKEQAAKDLESCVGGSVENALKVAKDSGIDYWFKNQKGDDVTSDVEDDAYAGARSRALVTAVDVSDPYVAFTIDRDMAITPEDSEELRNLLQLHDEFDSSIGAFAQKYKGKTIEFDGCVASLANHGSAKTRYDILILAMDYDPNSAIGPYFQFNDVAVTSLKWAGTQPDSVQTGMNLHIVASVGSFDSSNGLFRLEPIELSLR